MSEGVIGLAPQAAGEDHLLRAAFERGAHRQFAVGGIFVGGKAALRHMPG